MARSTISSLFGSSPVKPLQTHMASVQECIAELVPFFEAVIQEDWKKARTQQKKIARLEGQADKLKRELRMHLPKSLFMPVSRRDLLEVLTMQDKIANKAKDIAGLIIGRKIVLPEALHDAFMEYVGRCIEASAQAQTAINELDELMETGFGGKELSLLESMIKKLDAIESETDKIQVKIRSAVFAKEKEMDPVEVMFLYKVIDWVGDLADLAQRVGSRFELMLAR
ncbi:TIGR00153 family protein [Sulfuriflexus sp.]|uniref:TIGR00153 family protein n=1 Tax=Sulfuriflexus sp. TaxID=2015443 RepID=UPI0028CF4B57|nr:TIGR00153 family protein [Sulfuriflexus sp.]MDT8405167.1 TIGR00153 family protein [Sulfuriflexus sp.]